VAKVSWNSARSRRGEKSTRVGRKGEGKAEANHLIREVKRKRGV